MAVLPLQRPQPDFEAVYQRHHQALYRYCRSILRHEQDAQDALQNTMARAISALQDERREIELRPWLFRIAHNEAISILRRRRATAELDDAPAAGDLEDRIHEREELRALATDLAALPERQRAALVLRELNGLSHVEIGAVLELSPGAVKTAIFEARSTLCCCREARATACQDIRRMLSDGDGRVLRGRGVRAHMRSCTDCRRFHAQLAQRPRKLALLAPPLPGAALLSQLLGGTAAKLIACAVLAGTSTTLAVEMRATRGATPAAAATAGASAPRPASSATPENAATPAGSGGPAVQTQPADRPGSRPGRGAEHPAQPTVAGPKSPGRPFGEKPAPAAGVKPVRGEQPAQLDKPAEVQEPAEAEKPAKVEQPAQADHPAKAEEPAEAEKPAKVEKPAKAEKPAKVENPPVKADKTPPGQAKKETAAEPPGQAKKDATPPGEAKQEVAPVAPGQVKKAALPATPDVTVAPGQLKKDDPDRTPPGQAKKN